MSRDSGSVRTTQLQSSMHIIIGPQKNHQRRRYRPRLRASSPDGRHGGEPTNKHSPILSTEHTHTWAHKRAHISIKAHQQRLMFYTQVLLRQQTARKNSQATSLRAPAAAHLHNWCNSTSCSPDICTLLQQHVLLARPPLEGANSQKNMQPWRQRRERRQPSRCMPACGHAWVVTTARHMHDS